MKETGIIMSGDHPLKCLDGTKTMTRRVIKPQPMESQTLVRYMCDIGAWQFSRGEYDQSAHHVRCPYGQVGDLLVIKEAWATEYQYDHLKPSEIPHTATIYYLCDDLRGFAFIGRKRSAMFMCNWMSRAKPEITGLRAERLQEITEEDARAEGANGYLAEKFKYGELYRVFKPYHKEYYPLVDHADIGDIVRFQGPNMGFACFQSRNPKCLGGTLNIDGKIAFDYVGLVEPDYRSGFRILWDSLNAKRGYGWDKNPWVWPIGF